MNFRIIRSAISVGFLGLIVSSAFSSELSAKCKVSISKDLSGLKNTSLLKNFEVEGKKYSFAYVELAEDGEESAQYVLLESLKGGDCKILDTDVSFVGYLFGVDASLKSKAPQKAFETAIKAELAHQLNTEAAKKHRLELLKKKAKLKDITKDEEWVLNYLSREIGS